MAVCVLFAALNGGFAADAWMFAVGILLWSTGLFILMRFGLVAAVTAMFVAISYINFPITLDASAWYFSTGFAALIVIAAIVLYAFRYSLGGRPLLSPSRLDD